MAATIERRSPVMSSQPVSWSIGTGKRVYIKSAMIIIISPCDNYRKFFFVSGNEILDRSPLLERSYPPPVETETEKSEERARSRSPSPSRTHLPSITQHGMRLGTPVAREAAKSFWSMDMLKTSINRMAFYADCENHSQSSLVSTDSGCCSEYSKGPSARATPTTPRLSLPPLTTSAPSSPVSSSNRLLERRRESQTNNFDYVNPASQEALQQFLSPVNESQLIIARRQRELDNHSASSENVSTASLSGRTNSSKTISPALSHSLLPRRHRRSLSAEEKLLGATQSRQLVSQKSVRKAHSISSLYHFKQTHPVVLSLTEFQTLNSNFDNGFHE